MCCGSLSDGGGLTAAAGLFAASCLVLAAPSMAEQVKYAQLNGLLGLLIAGAWAWTGMTGKSALACSSVWRRR